MLFYGDGVLGVLFFDLDVDGKDISEAPKDDFPCVEKTQ
jgi:hypothetical protein